MAVRHQTFQRVQLGLEVTPGTAVAAGKRLLATYFRPSPQLPHDPHHTVGSRFPSGSSAQKDWTNFEMTGRMAFNDLAYMFSSLLVKKTGAGPWTFKPTPEALDPLATYTMEHGDNVNAEKWAYGMVSGISLRCNRTTAEVRGNGFGRSIQEGVTITPTPTKVPKILVDPKAFDIYVGDSVAGLTKIAKGFEFGFNYGNAREGLFPLNTDQMSFDEPVDGIPDFTATVNLQHDAIAAGYMTDLKNAASKYIRLVALGPNYTVGTPYKFQLTMAFTFVANDRNETNRVHASTFNLLPDDSETTIGSPLEVLIDSSHSLP